MSEFERLQIELEIDGIKKLIDFHVKDAEIKGWTQEKQDHIDDILDLLQELLKKLQEND